MKRVVASSIIMKHLYLPKVLWLTSQPWYQVFCSGWVRPQSRVDSCISSSRVQLLNVADACRWDRGEGGMNELSKWFRIGWTVSFASWTFSSFPPPREKHYYNTYCHKFFKKMKNSLCPTLLLAWIGTVAQRLEWVSVQIGLCLIRYVASMVAGIGLKQVVIIFVYVGSKLKIKWISTDRKIAGSSDWWVGSAWHKKYTSRLLFYQRFLPLGKMYVTCYQYSLLSKIS